MKLEYEWIRTLSSKPKLLAFTRETATRMMIEDKSNELDSFIPQGHHSCYAAWDAGTRESVAAFAVVIPWEGRLFIGCIWTANRHRRKGVFTKMVNDLLPIAKTFGLQGVSSNVFVGNATSLAAHTKVMTPFTQFFYKDVKDASSAK